MKTQYIEINLLKPDKELIKLAANLIKNQELVAFPTETVYGLGADAFCPEAVEKIFKAKGRPPQHPLLVHVNSLEQVYPLVEYVSDDALQLMQNFWPGPLSLVLPSSPRVPDLVRGGRTGVGIRMPDHEVALSLIEYTGPLAAPSANRYGRPSPITAQHVKDELDGRIAAVLDAGPTGMGMESTLIDLQNQPYKLLRRGGIPLEEIVKILGKPVESQEMISAQPYLTPLSIFLARDLDELELILQDCFQGHKKAALVNHRQARTPKPAYKEVSLEYELDLEEGGTQLYSIIRECEAKGIDQLVFAPLPSGMGGIALAIIDRISRAASPKG